MLAHLIAKSSCVHGYGTTNGGGKAHKPIKTLKPFFQRKGHKLRKKHSSLSCNMKKVPFPLYSKAFKFSHTYNQTFKIAKDGIRTPAKDKDG